MANKPRKISVAGQVRERVLRSREKLWRVEDFDGSPQAVNSELRRLVANGEIRRVRRGVYWRGRPSRFGMSSVAEDDAVQTVVGSHEAIGATGWHATNLLGLSTQVPGVASLAVTHRTPDGLSGVRVSSRAGRSGRRRERLSAIEVTILEALEGWDHYVELDAKTAVDRFGRILERDDVRIPRLVRASATEPPVVRERLRAVLQRTGHADEASSVPRARDPRTRAKALRVLEDAH